MKVPANAFAPPLPELVKMATLARRSGVPAATIKHYIREGLLPPPAKRTGRNMAFYDTALTERIQVIKRLQREHFLPLRVIKEMIEGGADGAAEATAAAAIERTLARVEASGRRSRAELVAAGVAPELLDWLGGLGVVSPHGEGDSATYGGDDVELLRTLAASRRAGITPEMLEPTILADYARALRELVRIELAMFRSGVLPHAGKELSAIAEAATTLSERLVVLIRRKLLLPTLAQMVSESQPPSVAASRRPRPASKRPPARARAAGSPSAASAGSRRTAGA